MYCKNIILLVLLHNSDKIDTLLSYCILNNKNKWIGELIVNIDEQ